MTTSVVNRVAFPDKSRQQEPDNLSWYRIDQKKSEGLSETSKRDYVEAFGTEHIPDKGFKVTHKHMHDNQNPEGSFDPDMDGAYIIQPGWILSIAHTLLSNVLIGVRWGGEISLKVATVAAGMIKQKVVESAETYMENRRKRRKVSSEQDIEVPSEAPSSVFTGIDEEALLIERTAQQLAQEGHYYHPDIPFEQTRPNAAGLGISGLSTSTPAKKDNVPEFQERRLTPLFFRGLGQTGTAPKQSPAYDPTCTPLFSKTRNDNDSPDRGRDSIQAPPIIRNVTYGTAFFLNSTSKPDDNLESHDTLPKKNMAEWLRNAYKGTYVRPKESLSSVSGSYVQQGRREAFNLSPSEKSYLHQLEKRRNEIDTSSLQMLRRDLQTGFLHSRPLYGSGKLSLPKVSIAQEVLPRYEALIKQRKELEEEISKLKVDEASDDLPDLSDEQIEQVQGIWNGRYNSRQVLCTEFKIDIAVHDLQSLSHGSWLNDNVIDFYLTLVTERTANVTKSFAFSTHFYSKLSTGGYKAVERWAKRKKIDVTEMDYVFVPVNVHGQHWCMGVINNIKSQFEYYDSLSPGDSGIPVTKRLREYMVAECKRLGKPDSVVRKYLYDYSALPRMECPKQRNGFDCGVFASTVAERLASNRDVMGFSQDDMSNIRLRIACDILQRGRKSVSKL